MPCWVVSLGASPDATWWVSPPWPRSTRYHDARRVLDQLATAGVDFDDVTGQLEREGLAKFEKSWNELSHTIAAELHRNHPARQP